MKIEILGSGCAKCVALEKNVRQAVADSGLDAEIVKVTDIKEIMNYDIMMTPGLVVDGQVKASGKLLSPEQIRELL